MNVVIVILMIILAVIAFFILSYWGAAIVLVLGIAFAVYTAVARKQDRSVATIERGARREPTGVPRSGSGDAETANQRVGQE